MPGGGADAARRGRTHRVVVWAGRSRRSGSTRARLSSPTCGGGCGGRAGPSAETVDDWSQGVPLAYAPGAVPATGRRRTTGGARGAAQRAFRQFRTEIDGLGIHFLHVRSPNPEALPLVITHGWPGSVVEFLEGHRPLTDPAAHGGDPADAFHVVCPSLPGYGFSDKPERDRVGRVERIAAGLGGADGPARLRPLRRPGRRLGLGGDDRRSARQDRTHLAGIHLNMVSARPRIRPTTIDRPSRSRRRSPRSTYYGERDSGYSKQQSTRPQTLGYGLVDSPAGAVRVDPGEVLGLDRLRRRSRRPPSAPTHPRQRDALLAARHAAPRRPGCTGRASPAYAPREPVGCRPGASIFPKEIFRPSRRWAERQFTDIRYWNELDRGGHFAAFEQPELFVDEVRAFFRLVRD